MANSKKKSKKNKHVSQVELEYRKQRKRLQNAVYRARKKGYIFPDNIIPERPKKITKAYVNRLSKITAAQIRNKGTIGPSPTVHYNPPRISDNVLRHIEEIIDRFPEPNDWKTWQYEIHAKHHNMLRGMLTAQISLNGRTVIAQRLERTSADVVQIIERIIYGDSDEESFQIDLAWFAEIIKGEALSADEAEEIRELTDSYDE